MEKVLLDTDIGSDIDDAVCLAYLLAQPACELAGITTVTGQPALRARMCSALCVAAGRDDIPICPGSATPFFAAQRQPNVPQARALANWPHREAFPDGEAIEFLRRTVRASPGEITLLAIGPMTNVGLLFALDPEIPSLLKRLVLMNGHFSMQAGANGCGDLVEWNSGGDPHATALIYRGRSPVDRSVGTDITTRVVMNSAQVKERFKAKLLQPVLDFAGAWFEHTDRMTFHDPLAAATIFDESICRFDRGLVTVEIADESLAGLTGWTPSADGPHEVAVDVDSARFFEHFFSVLGD